LMSIRYKQAALHQHPESASCGMELTDRPRGAALLDARELQLAYQASRAM